MHTKYQANARKIKIAIFFILCTLLFSSCVKTKEEVEQISEKQDFFIQTKKLSSFTWSYEIKKTGKIKPSQEIILTSKVSGRVWSINSDFWQNVYAGQNLVNLVDNVSNYGLNLEKSSLSLESSKLSYDQNKISLDKQVEDAEIALAREKKDHEILEKKIKEDIELAKINLDNSLSWNNDSVWFTSKAQLDYENLLKSNQEQIKTFESTSKNDYLSLKNSFVDVIDFSDGILWITNLNKSRNDSFEDYLWVKDSIFLKETEREFIDLMKFKEDTFDSIWKDDLNIENLDSFFNVAIQSYTKIIAFLDSLEKVLDNSVENIYFTRTEIDSYKTQTNSYQTELQSKYNSLLSFRSSVREFLNTYSDEEEILRKSLEISGDTARVSYNKTVLDWQKSINDSLLSLKTAELNLQNAEKNREVVLKQLQNSIDLAENSRSLSYKEYQKLSISSPINWVVSDILVDIWEDVTLWTPLIKLSSLWTNELEVWFSFSEVDYIKPWDIVKVDYLWSTLSWTINSISKIADENLNYKSRISVDSPVSISWNIVDVFVPITLSKRLIELKDVKVKSNWLWEVNVLWAYSSSDNEKQSLNVEKVLLELWTFYWEKVEILSCIDLNDEICSDLEIVISDLSRFDETKFSLKMKNSPLDDNLEN